VKEKTFNRLKQIGGWTGMLFIVTGFYYSMKTTHGWPFIAGFVAYWVINYGLIRGLIEAKFLDDEINE